MKVHHGTQNYFSTPVRSQQDAGSDGSSPFTLPDDSSEQETQAPSIASGGVPSSISSGLWLSQIGSTSSSATDGSTGGDSTGTTSNSSSTSSSEQPSQDILDEFTKWANMSPAQKIRAQYLEENNLTEDSLKALPSAEQKAINDQIAAEIKQKLGTDENDADKETDSASAALSIA